MDLLPNDCKYNILVQLEWQELGRICKANKTFKCRKFKNRDMNAALNILRCFKGGNKRPNVLDRNSGVALVKGQSLMIT